MKHGGGKIEGSGEIISPVGGWGESPEIAPHWLEVSAGDPGNYGQARQDRLHRPPTPSLAAFPPAFDCGERSPGPRRYELRPFVRGGEGDALRDEGRPSPPSACGAAGGDSPRLFIEHKPSPPAPPVSRKQGEGPRISTIWLGASRVDIPARLNLAPPKSFDEEWKSIMGDRDQRKRTEDGELVKPLRGEIRGFSAGSRLRLLRLLGTFPVDAAAFTMALTLPGEFGELSLPDLARAFGVMGRRFSSVRRFRKISALWKREQQRRGALHWHFIFYGLGDDLLAADVREWMVSTWLSVLSSFFPPHVIAKMRKVHAHESNWIELSGRDFTHYFSKYLGKDSEAGNPVGVPGRWWGSWNKKALPKVEAGTIELPQAVADDYARAFSKRRRVRAQAAMDRAAARASPINSLFSTAPVLDVSEDGKVTYGPPPLLTPWDVQRLKSGYTSRGKDPVHAAALYRHVKICQRLVGKNFKKWVLTDGEGKQMSETVSMVAVGSGLPELALRVIANSCRNRGFPVPPLILENEKKAQIRATMSDFLKASPVNSARLAESALVPPWLDGFGSPEGRLHESARRSKATLARRRLGSGYAGVAE